MSFARSPHVVWVDSVARTCLSTETTCYYSCVSFANTVYERFDLVVEFFAHLWLCIACRQGGCICTYHRYFSAWFGNPQCTHTDYLRDRQVAYLRVSPHNDSHSCLVDTLLVWVVNSVVSFPISGGDGLCVILLWGVSSKDLRCVSCTAIMSMSWLYITIFCNMCLLCWLYEASAVKACKVGFLISFPIRAHG